MKYRPLPSAAVLACVILALAASDARGQELPASTAFPGSFWVAAGDVGPSERDNMVGQVGFEQGVTVWAPGSWYVVPFLSGNAGTDTDGYDWNNRRQVQVGSKLIRRVPGGVVQIGGSLMFERDPATEETRHPSVFANYWAGWRADKQSGNGRTLNGFPGYAYASSGLLSGRDPDNWLTSIGAQQGIVAFRSRIVTVVPYGAATVTADTKRRLWENRLTYDGGIKIVRALVGGVVEAGFAQRRQHELITGRVETAPVAYINLWIGWNPHAVSALR